MNCHDISKLSDKEFKNKQRQVYEYLLKKVVKNKNFELITSSIVKQTFKVFDKVYFNNEIGNRINRTGSSLSFNVSGRLTTTAGLCNYKIYFDDYDEFDYGEFNITISKPIINSLFSDKKTKSLKINGIHCFNKLECYINLFEHELIHMFIALFCYHEGKCSGGHTPMFKKITYNLFRHTEYKHMLLSGDSLQNEKDEKHNKLNVEVGDYVTTKQNKNKTSEGTVYKTTSKYVYIDVVKGNYSGKKMGFPFNRIDKIKKGSNKKIIKNKNMSTDKIKKKLKIGSKIKVKVKGTIHNGEILSLNEKRASVKLDNNQKWYIPYNMIIL